MYANVKVVERGVIFLGGKSPRGVIFQGVNCIGGKSPKGNSPRG